MRDSSVPIRIYPYSLVVKNKNPTAVWQWGSINLVNESEPDRRAAQPQRVWQQVQIQIAIHDNKVPITSGHVKWF